MGFLVVDGKAIVFGFTSSDGRGSSWTTGSPACDPGLVSALHVDDIEPGSLQDARCDCRTTSRQALNHHRLVLANALDIPQQRAEEAVLGAGDVPSMKFRRRTHVDERDVAIVDACAGARPVLRTGTIQSAGHRP